MTAIFTTFGIDWHLLLIQGVNFGILVAGLTYFLYKPVMRMIEERRRAVAKGVEDARAAEAKLRQIEDSRDQVLADAGREADELVGQARAAAAARGREIVQKGEVAAAAALREAELEAQELKERALKESKHELAKLVVLGVEKSMQSK